MCGWSPVQRSKEIRQLSAPKSIATTLGKSFPDMQEPLVTLAEKRVGQTAINWNKVAGCTRSLWPCKEKNCLRAGARIDRHMRQSALSIKLCQQPAKLIVARFFLKWNVVFLQRGNNPVTWKHG